MMNNDDSLKKKKNLFQTIGRALRIFSSRNKVAEVEKIIAGSAVSEINKLSSYAFMDEMEKIAVSGQMLLSKIPIIDKLKLSIVKPEYKQKILSMVDNKDPIRAINYLNSSTGRGLIRSVPYKQHAYQPLLNEKNTYRKPGQV